MTSSSVRTPKLQLSTEQLSTGECWIPPKKYIPCPREKEKPQQDDRRDENALRIVAAAKLLQLCPTLHNPIDGLLPGSSVPGILQARTLEWVAISFSNA